MLHSEVLDVVLQRRIQPLVANNLLQTPIKLLQEYNNVNEMY